MSRNYYEFIFDLKNKEIVITGACGYFGRYICSTFLNCGAKIIMMSSSDEVHKDLLKYQNKFGPEKAYAYQVDFYEKHKFSETLSVIIKNHNVDVVINNAFDISKNTGFNDPSGRLENLSFKQWQFAFESGIYWAVMTTQLFGESFKKQKKGNIINITTMYAHVSPNPDLYKDTDLFNPPTYSINKAGLLALTRYVASFWGKFGIRCNALSPGPFPNTENEKSYNRVEKDSVFLNRLKENTVLKRTGHPNDLRGALIYLASDASSYMTGQALIIDGGWTIT